MPSDFGDESGEKLFDYLLRVGQDAGEAAMYESATRLVSAFRNMREGARNADADLSGLDVEAGVGADAPRWAKLSMAEFEQLPEYQSIKEIISSELDRAGVEHDFFSDKNRTDHLLFKVEDAPDVSEAFEGLERSAQRACDEALKARGVTREQVRDMEPLAKKAEAARQASEIADAEDVRDVQRNRLQSRSK